MSKGQEVCADEGTHISEEEHSEAAEERVDDDSVNRYGFENCQGKHGAFGAEVFGPSDERTKEDNTDDQSLKEKYH